MSIRVGGYSPTNSSITSFYLCERLTQMSTYSNAHTKTLNNLLWFSSRKNYSSSVLFVMIFEAFQFEPFRFKFYTVSSKLLQFLEFNLCILNFMHFLILSLVFYYRIFESIGSCAREFVCKIIFSSCDMIHVM